MAWQSQNVLYVTSPDGRVIWYDFYKFLKLHGWTVVKSSDGIATFGPGDNIVSSGSGAGGIQNTGAWVVMREPSGLGGRELCWSTNASAQWLIRYSRSDGFTTAGTLTVAPTSPTDSQFVWDNAGAPIWAYWNTAPQSVVMSVSDAPHNGAYPFHLHINTRNGYSNTQFGMSAILEGTEEVGDTDPVLFYGVTASSFSEYSVPNSRAWTRYQELTGRSWGAVELSYPSGSSTPPGNSRDGIEATGAVLMSPLLAQTAAGGTANIFGQVKGILWDLRTPAVRALTYPQVINENLPDSWIPGAPDSSASGPGQRICFPWVGPRPKV